MNIIRYVYLLFLLIMLIGCSSPSEKFYQPSDGEKLLIYPNDLPATWQLQTSWNGPLSDGANEWRSLYVQPEYQGSPIVSSATVFEEETVAIEYWEELYSTQTSAATSSCLTSLEQSARSNFADQFEFLCFDSESSLKQLETYEFFVIARYGNGVSTFGAVVIEDDDLTMEQASQIGALRQVDMEALLMLLDKKFQQAGSN